MDEHPGHGIALNTFTRTTPPGWSPGNRKYPLRLYHQLLRLWWKQTTVSEEQAGPTMAGRLRGTALQLALSLSAYRYCYVREEWTTFVGDELLAQPSAPETTLLDGTVVAAQLAGAAVLMNALNTEFGVSTQDLASQALESFTEFRQANLSLLDYITQFRLVFDEACTQSGLAMNNVGKTHFFFKYSNLTGKQKHDFLLQIGGDRSRYEDLMSIISRFATAEANDRGSGVADLARMYWHEDSSWDDSGWDDDSSWLYWNEPWSESSWEDAAWYIVDEPWSCADVPAFAGAEASEPWTGTESAVAPQQVSTSASGPSTATQSEIIAYGKGKGSNRSKSGPGKGKGSGCAICGAPYHWKDECPLNTGRSESDHHWSSGEPWSSDADEYVDWYPETGYDDEIYFGGKRKGFRKGKSKGKGKGKFGGKNFGKG